jgi:hypothetical protein
MILSASGLGAIEHSMYYYYFFEHTAGKLLLVGSDRSFRSSFDRLRTTNSGRTDLFLLRVPGLLHANDTHLMHVGDAG